MVALLRGRARQLYPAPGFSLIEVLVVVAIAGVIAVVAVPVSNKFITWARADSSSEFTIRAISAARDRAIAERRNIELTFVMPNRLRLERQDVNAAGVTTGKTVLSEVILENGQEFLKFASITLDTPDLFGSSSAITFGGTAPVMFTSDGSLVDSAGDVINGTILTGIRNQPETARAVTVFGVSGLTKIWKWRGSAWLQ
jgi:prepilin-type N-terminal cleavage/methylation domain-containing protein